MRHVFTVVPVQYGEFRVGFNKDALDTRVVSYGIRWLIDHYISKQWTQHDIDCAEIFYRYVCAVLWVPGTVGHLHLMSLSSEV